jgi:hypothetical protein
MTLPLPRLPVARTTWRRCSTSGPRLRTRSASTSRGSSARPIRTASSRIRRSSRKSLEAPSTAMGNLRHLRHPRYKCDVVLKRPKRDAYKRFKRRPRRSNRPTRRRRFSSTASSRRARRVEGARGSHAWARRHVRLRSGDLRGRLEPSSPEKNNRPPRRSAANPLVGLDTSTHGATGPTPTRRTRGA